MMMGMSCIFLLLRGSSHHLLYEDFSACVAELNELGSGGGSPHASIQFVTTNLLQRECNTTCATFVQHW